MVVTKAANGFILNDGGNPIVYKRNECGLMLCDLLVRLGLGEPRWYEAGGGVGTSLELGKDDQAVAFTVKFPF